MNCGSSQQINAAGRLMKNNCKAKPKGSPKYLAGASHTDSPSASHLQWSLQHTSKYSWVDIWSWRKIYYGRSDTLPVIWLLQTPGEQWAERTRCGRHLHWVFIQGLNRPGVASGCLWHISSLIKALLALRWPRGPSDQNSVHYSMVLVCPGQSLCLIPWFLKMYLSLQCHFYF